MDYVCLISDILALIISIFGIIRNWEQEDRGMWILVFIWCFNCVLKDLIIIY